MSRFNVVYGLLEAIGFLSVITVSAAQTDVEHAKPPQDSDSVVVTAQKREQNLQDVPITVSAFSTQQLQAAGVYDIKSLTILTPGLTVTSTSSEAITTARIRGIGTVGDNPGLESSVGVVIDGVYRPRNGVSFGDLGELQRIEVLKGPQGTIFGKNTSAGVIQVLTEPPKFEFGGKAELTSGGSGIRGGSVAITGPVFGDHVAARLYVAKRERDGFYDVQTGGGPRKVTEDENQDFVSARGQLLWLPTESTSVRLIGDYTDRDESCCVAVQTRLGPTAPIIDALASDSGLKNPANPFARQAFINRPTPQRIKDRGLSGEVNWKLPALNGATLTSISAWRQWDFVNGLDADYSTADIWYRASDGRYGNSFEQATEELRLAGQAGRSQWLIGAFVGNEKLDSHYNLSFGSAFEQYYSLLFSQGAAPTLVSTVTGLTPGAAYPLDAGLQDFFDHRSRKYAIFTNNTVSFTSLFEGTIGLRYTSEKKRLESQYTNVGGGSEGCAASRARRPIVDAVFAAAPAGTAANWFNFGCGVFADPAFDSFSSTQEISDNEWSGTAKLAYHLTAQLMGYASYTRGHKAAGFNLDRERIVNQALGAADPGSRPDTDTSFPAEVVDSYELGIKSVSLGGALTLNGSLFYEKFDDFQLNTFTGVAFVVASIPEVKSRGADLDILWFSPGHSFSMQGGITYADTRYGNFTPPPDTPATLPGNQMSLAPKWSGSVSAIWSRPLGERMRWSVSVSEKTVSSYNTGSDLNPAKEQGGYSLLNARVGVGSTNEHWMVEAWSENLTDKDYYQVVIDAPLQPGSYVAYLGAPRMYGLTLRVNL